MWATHLLALRRGSRRPLISCFCCCQLALQLRLQSLLVSQVLGRRIVQHGKLTAK